MPNEIESLLKEKRIFKPGAEFSKKAQLGTIEEYKRLYDQSINEPEKFWSEQASKNLHWFKMWDRVLDYDFSSIGKKSAPYLGFFLGGTTNVCYNCLDRHLETKKDKIAIIWQAEKSGEGKGQKRTLTYQELYDYVCRFSNVLKRLGVKKGSVVTIFLPMIPEAAVAMLACARIGAIHSVVFSAFSSEALKNRIEDCKSEFVITADACFYAGKIIELKNKVDKAIEQSRNVKKVIVFNRANTSVTMKPGRDLWWHEEINSPEINNHCPPEEAQSEDPLFILYTSGSTGKPKGVLHTTAGYLLFAHLTFKYVIDIRNNDIYWCTADVGWITGHSYVVYAPLSNGATTLMFEGVPTYPDPDRFWQVVEEHKVNIFYTAPTAIRTLMRFGEAWPEKHDLSSLRLLGTVG